MTVLGCCILVPFLLFDARMTDFSRSALASVESNAALSYTIMVALLASDVVLPVPSSLVSVAGGRVLGFWAGLAAIWLGMTLGCALGYALGRSGGRAALRRILGERELGRARHLFEREGAAALILARGVPVLAEASVIGAGAARMPFAPFILLTSLANLAVAAAYAAIGALSLAAGSFLPLFLGLVAVPALSWLVWRRFSA